MILRFPVAQVSRLSAVRRSAAGFATRSAARVSESFCRLAGEFHLGSAIGYLIVRLVASVIQVLPLDMGNAVCHGLARLLAGPLPIRRRETDENFARIFPDADPGQLELLRYQMWHSLLLTVCEVAWATRRLHRCNWSRHVRFQANRKMLADLLSDRPTVMVTGHYGNFEIGGYVTGLMGFRCLAIARRLDNVYLHRWVERFRGAKGQFMVDKEGCAAEVQRHLDSGGILSLLADQHAGDKGCWVDFMGCPASCHKALALFSMTAQAPMFVPLTRRLEGRPMQFEICSHGRLDPADSDDDPHTESVTAMTDWYNERLASGVSVDVSQYWWLHRRWRRPPERVLRRLAKRAA